MVYGCFSIIIYQKIDKIILFFPLYFCCTMQLVEYWFCDQGLNPGHGSERAEFYALVCQGAPEICEVKT